MKKIITSDLRETIAVLPRNKYAMATALFLCWMVACDDNKVGKRIALDNRVDYLTNELDYLDDQIEQNRRKITELKTNKESLEKFAREEYFMKKDDEVIFIVK